jgi:hypothetical protein
MQKAGGIVALVAGILGTLAALVTLLIGGLGSAFNSSGSGTVVALGWGGVAFSFATIVLGAIAMGAKSRVPGVLLIVSAVFGAILGGTLVAVFMVLALVGGILAVIGVKKPVAAEAVIPQPPVAPPTAIPQPPVAPAETIPQPPVAPAEAASGSDPILY